MILNYLSNAAYVLPYSPLSVWKYIWFKEHLEKSVIFKEQNKSNYKRLQKTFVPLLKNRMYLSTSLMGELIYVAKGQ